MGASITMPKHPAVSVAGIDKLQEENVQLKAQLQKVTAEKKMLQNKLNNIRKWGE